MTAPVERFARHALIPEWRQEALTAASAVIIGIGAVGSEVGRLLAQTGIGRLLLCDPDAVEESNLSRGALHGSSDVGRPKAEAAADALRARHPGLAVTARVADLRNGVGLAELRAANLVLSCLDSIADRVALAARCNLVGVGMLDAGTYAWGAEIRNYPAGGTCYACGCTPTERALTTWHVACADPPRHSGASAPVSALAGAWQASAALRLLFGLSVAAGAVRLDLASGESHAVALRRDPECPCHRRLDPGRVTATGLPAAATVAEILTLVQPGEQALAWGPIVPGDPIGPTELASADPGARLADLGIPPGEILPVVRPPGGIRYLELEKEAVG